MNSQSSSAPVAEGNTWQPTTATKVVAVVIFAMAFLFFWQLVGGFQQFYDFNTYYYGAQVERGGTYTDAHAVVALAAESGHKVGDVWGSASLVALVFIPLSFFSQAIAIVIWQVVTGLILFVGAYKAGGKRWPLFVLLLALSPGLWWGIKSGNAGVGLAGMFALSYAYLREGKDYKAGLWLGLATALKFYPGFLLVVLVAKGRWKAAGAMIGVGAALSILPLPIMGFHDFVLGTKALGQVADLSQGWSISGSIPSIVGWHFQGAPAQITNYVCLIGGACLILCLRRLDASHLLAVGVAIMLLAQAISWVHYFPMVFLVVVAMAERKMTRMQIRITLLAYGLAVSWPVWEWAREASPQILSAVGTIALLGLLLRRAPLQPPWPKRGPRAIQ